MSIIKKLLGHTSIYVSSELIITAGGLISFPIITRFLSQEEYGTMTLIGITVAMIESLSCMGLNHSAQRFYWDYEKNKLSSFVTTLFLGSVFFGITGTLVAVLILNLLGVFDVFQGNIKQLLLVASLLVSVRVTTKAIGAIYRAKEQPFIYSLFAILSKYAGIGLIIFFLAYTLWGIFGYYVGLVVGELAVLAVFLFVFIKQNSIIPANFSPVIMKQTIAYGFPLILSGLTSVLMSGSDRYLIGYFLSLSDVALYSVPYNLCGYLTGILVSGFQFGFIPIIMKEWNRGAIEETHLEIQRVIRLYCCVSFPILPGLAIVGRNLIILLASAKYAQAANILPYIAGASLLSGLCSPLMIGLWFFNKTKTVAWLNLQAAAVNFVLNLVLIPWMGLKGAVVATLFSYAFLLVAGTMKSSALFRIMIPWKSVGLYFICTAIMYAILRVLLENFQEINLSGQVALGIAIYAILIYVFDGKIRNEIHTQMKRHLQ